VTVGSGVAVSVGSGVAVSVGSGVAVSVGSGVAVSVGSGVAVSVGSGFGASQSSAIRPSRYSSQFLMFCFSSLSVLRGRPESSRWASRTAPRAAPHLPASAAWPASPTSADSSSARFGGIRASFSEPQPASASAPSAVAMSL
jgi:hypothetical protein